MEKLRDIIRKPDFQAEKFEGYLVDEFQFQRLFFLENRELKLVYEEINDFLYDNGYDKVDFSSLSEQEPLDLGELSLSLHPFVNQESRRVVLTIKRFDPWDNPVDRVLVELKKFRDARDWSQFHNSKDLSLALSIEASELLELFLWKDKEGADPEKLKEELADIFLYGLLLMEKHGLDFEDILMAKIKSNDEKYPVSKAKGTAKKYDEL